jgi:hypothetical protein
VQALERSPAPMRPPLRPHGPAYPADLAMVVCNVVCSKGSFSRIRMMPWLGARPHLPARAPSRARNCGIHNSRLAGWRLTSGIAILAASVIAGALWDGVVEN